MAADDEAAGAGRADEAVDDILRIARLPVGEARCGDLGHGDRPHAARPERRVEAAALEVGGDDLADLPTRRVGAPPGTGGTRRGCTGGNPKTGALLGSGPEEGRGGKKCVLNVSNGG